MFLSAAELQSEGREIALGMGRHIMVKVAVPALCA